MEIKGKKKINKQNLVPLDETVVKDVLVHLGSVLDVPALLGEVTLVGEEDDGDGLVVGAVGDLGVDVGLPLGHRLERADPRHVKHDQCSYCFL